MEGFDLSTISGIYVGNTQYSEIYYGSNKIWPTDQQYRGFCRLTLNDDSVVELQGSGSLTSTMTNPYRSSVVNAEIPVKYNTVDYFMLVENVRINNETALRELKRGKASEILDKVMDSLEFLSYIHK